METKKPWQSKTLVLNALLGILAAVGLFVPGAESVSTFLTSHASEVAMVWSLANIILRAITKDKIALVD